MTRDIQEKMKAMGVPKAYQGQFLQDVMGSFYSPDTKGLVDAESDEEMLLSLSPIWDKREAEFSSRKPSLHAWFSKYHSRDVQNSMIVPIRERAGLGHPPAHFTTNSNESMNKVIKQALHYEEKNWDKFRDDMLTLVKTQYQELEKAVVCTVVCTTYLTIDANETMDYVPTTVNCHCFSLVHRCCMFTACSVKTCMDFVPTNTWLS